MSRANAAARLPRSTMDAPDARIAGATMATENPTDTAGPVRDLVVEAARTQLAAVSAGIRFWAAWVEFSRPLHPGRRCGTCPTRGRQRADRRSDGPARRPHSDVPPRDDRAADRGCPALQLGAREDRSPQAAPDTPGEGQGVAPEPGADASRDADTRDLAAGRRVLTAVGAPFAGVKVLRSARHASGPSVLGSTLEPTPPARTPTHLRCTSIAQRRCHTGSARNDFAHAACQPTRSVSVVEREPPFRGAIARGHARITSRTTAAVIDVITREGRTSWPPKYALASRANVASACASSQPRASASSHGPARCGFRRVVAQVAKNRIDGSK